MYGSLGDREVGPRYSPAGRVTPRRSDKSELARLCLGLLCWESGRPPSEGASRLAAEAARRRCTAASDLSGPNSTSSVTFIFPFKKSAPGYEPWRCETNSTEIFKKHKEPTSPAGYRRLQHELQAIPGAPRHICGSFEVSYNSREGIGHLGSIYLSQVFRVITLGGDKDGREARLREGSYGY